MHILGSISYSFSQRQKLHRPRDLHIRQLSFSGCSLLSGCSFSSKLSTSTACAPTPDLQTPTSSRSLGPLGSHHTFRPPPRLHERPLIGPERIQRPQTSAFFEEDDADEQDYISCPLEEEYEEYAVCSAKKISFTQPTMIVLPQRTIPKDHNKEQTEPQYYPKVQLDRQPPIHRPPWSGPTIQASDLGQMILEGSAADTYGVEALNTAAQVSKIPNFSYKRNTATLRSPMQSLVGLGNIFQREVRRGEAMSVFHEVDLYSHTPLVPTTTLN